MIISDPESYPFPTLLDSLAPGLKVVFVGINPSVFSVQRGHYFARPTNRFWPAFSRSLLSAPIRAALGRETLGPGDDRALLAFGIEFTDVVKVPSRNAGELRQAAYATWAPRLRTRLEHYQPLTACFHGVTAYRTFARYGLEAAEPTAGLGPQPRRLGSTHLYVVPNPSPANAHFTPQDQADWYDRLAEFLNGVARGGNTS